MIIDLVGIFIFDQLNVSFETDTFNQVHGAVLIYFSYIGLKNHVFFTEAGLKNYLDYC